VVVMRALIFCAVCTSIAGAAHVSAQQAYPAYPQLPMPNSMQVQPYGFPQQPYGYPQPPQYIYVPVPQTQPEPQVVKPAPMPQPAPAPVPEIKVDARPGLGQTILGGLVQGAAQSGMNRILGGL
jgi:hypothetical protein